MKKLALDIDDVIASMQPAFFKECGAVERKMDYWNDPEAIFMYMNHFGRVSKDVSFWSGLKPLISPESINGKVLEHLECYITSSPIDMINVRQHWLFNHGFPLKKVYYSNNKLETMEVLGIDILVDDKIATVKEINESDCHRMALQFKPPYMAEEYHDKELVITHLSEIEKWLH